MTDLQQTRPIHFFGGQGPVRERRVAEKPAGRAYALAVPENPPTNSELYVGPDVLESPSKMSMILRESAALAGEAGAEEIRLPCPSELAVDTSLVDVFGRQFTFAWMRKDLRDLAL